MVYPNTCLSNIGTPYDRSTEYINRNILGITMNYLLLFFAIPIGYYP